MGYRAYLILSTLVVISLAAVAENSPGFKSTRRQAIRERMLREQMIEQSCTSQPHAIITPEMHLSFSAAFSPRNEYAEYFNLLRQDPQMLLDTPLCGELNEFAAFISLCNCSDEIISSVLTDRQTEVIRLLADPKTFGRRFLLATACMDINARRNLIKEFAPQIVKLNNFYRANMVDFLWADLFWAYATGNDKSSKAIAELRSIATQRYQYRFYRFIRSPGLEWLKQYYSTHSPEGEQLKCEMLDCAARLAAMSIVISPSDYQKILDAAAVVAIDKPANDMSQQSAASVKGDLRRKIFSSARYSPAFLPLALKSFQNPSNGACFTFADFFSADQLRNDVCGMAVRAKLAAGPDGNKNLKQNPLATWTEYEWCRSQLLDYGVDVTGPLVWNNYSSDHIGWEILQLLDTKIKSSEEEPQNVLLYLFELKWASMQHVAALPDPELNFKLAEYNWKGRNAYQNELYTKIVACMLKTVNDAELSESWRFWRMIRLFNTTHGGYIQQNVKLMEPVFTVFSRITPDMVSKLSGDDFLALTPLMNFDSVRAIKNVGDFAAMEWAYTLTLKNGPSAMVSIWLANLAFTAHRNELGLEILNRDTVLHYSLSNTYLTPQEQSARFHLRDIDYTYILLAKYPAAWPLLKKWFAESDYYTMLHPWNRNFTPDDEKAVAKLLASIENPNAEIFNKAWLLTHLMNYKMGHEQWDDYYRRCREFINQKFPSPEIAVKVAGIMLDVNGRYEEREKLYLNIPIELVLKLPARERAPFFYAYRRAAGNCMDENSIRIINNVLSIQDHYFLRKTFAKDIAECAVSRLAKAEKDKLPSFSPKILDKVIRIVQPYANGKDITQNQLNSSSYYYSLRAFGVSAGIIEYLMGNRVYANGLLSGEGSLTKPAELQGFAVAAVYASLLHNGCEEKQLTKNLLDLCAEYQFENNRYKAITLREIISGLFYFGLQPPAVKLYEANHDLFEKSGNDDTFREYFPLICSMKKIKEGPQAVDEYVAKNLAEKKVTYFVVCDYYDSSDGDPQMVLKFAREAMQHIDRNYRWQILSREINAYDKLGQPLKAAQSAENFAKTQKRDFYVYYMQMASEFYQKAGDYNDAIRCIKELIDSKKKNPNDNSSLSTLYDRLYELINSQPKATSKPAA